MSARFIIVAWLLYLFFAGQVLLNDTKITSDLTFFLPNARQPYEEVIQTATREGPGSRMLLVEIRGGTASERFNISDALVKYLRTKPEFARVQGGANPQDLFDLEKKLFTYRWILSPASTDFVWTPLNFHNLLAVRINELSSSTGRLNERWLERDPLGLWKQYLDHLTIGLGPLIQSGHWVGNDGQTTLVLLETVLPGFDLGAQEHAQKLIRDAFATTSHGGMTLSIGGAGALAVETNQSISREATGLSIINTLMVSTLLVLVYRSGRILSLGLIPLLTGLVTGALAIRLQYGSLHAITLGFGSTLLGVAADYPNHFFTHLDKDDSPKGTMQRLWPTLRLGILTNIAGFGVMFFAGFKGLQEIGVFAAAGLFGAGLSTRFILPILSPPSAPIGSWIMGLSHTPWQRFSRSSRIVVCGLIPAGLILTFFCSGNALFNDDLATLNPVSPSRLEEDIALQKAFKVPDMRWMILVHGTSEEKALERCERLDPVLNDLLKIQAINRFELVCDILPSASTQRERINAFPDFQAAKKLIQRAIEGTSFQKDAFDPMIQDLSQLHSLPLITRETFKGTFLEPRINAQMIHSDNVTAILVPLEGIKDIEAIRLAIDTLKDSRIQFIDLRDDMTHQIRNNRTEAARLLALGLMTIFIILTIGLKSLRDAINVITPMLMATVTTGLILSLISDGLNIYHLASMLLVMGLSLDQALFFNRPCANLEERSRTHLSIFVCSLSSILAFGGLAVSSVPLLSAIGATVSLGAFVAITFAALLAK